MRNFIKRVFLTKKNAFSAVLFGNFGLTRYAINPGSDRKFGRNVGFSHSGGNFRRELEGFAGSLNETKAGAKVPAQCWSDSQKAVADFHPCVAGFDICALIYNGGRYGA